MKKLLKYIGIFFLVILTLVIIICAYFIIKSNVWANTFQKNIQEEYLVSEVSEYKNLFNDKIQNYVLNDNDVDFVSFTPTEVAHIVYDSLTDIVGDSSIAISNVYVVPAKGTWEICGLIFVEDYKTISGWICADITKDNMQTAQLYVENLLVQGINISNIYPPILVNINQGLAEALVTANENGFVGRVFENIELEEDKAIIKGSLY
jgi:hypothetical protein